MYEVRNNKCAVMKPNLSLESAMKQVEIYHNATKEPSGSNLIKYTIHNSTTGEEVVQ